MNANMFGSDRASGGPRLVGRRLRLVATAALSVLALAAYLASCVYSLHTLAHRLPQPFPLLPEQFGLLYHPLTVLVASTNAIGALWG
jgi:hypothetical protein